MSRARGSLWLRVVTKCCTLGLVAFCLVLFVVFCLMLGFVAFCLMLGCVAFCLMLGFVAFWLMLGFVAFCLMLRFVAFCLMLGRALRSSACMFSFGLNSLMYNASRIGRRLSSVHMSKISVFSSRMFLVSVMS